MAVQTTAEMMTDSVDWITKQAGKGNYPHVDATRIAAWGQSCGGLEAYTMSTDARVGSLGIFNSGQFSAAASNSVAPTIDKPIFYFLGGSTDIAYANVRSLP
jgi:dienelactone hydrolase